MKCSDCKHYRTNPQNLSQGECLRYPPIPYMVQGQLGQMAVVSIVPQIASDHTCGEFDKKPYCAMC